MLSEIQSHQTLAVLIKLAFEELILNLQSISSSNAHCMQTKDKYLYLRLVIVYQFTFKPKSRYLMTFQNYVLY